MSQDKIRCVRCKGRKKLFKVRGAYSMINTGGIEVTCPMCNGEGRIKTLEQAIKDSEKDLEDLQDANQKEEPDTKSKRKTKTCRGQTDKIQSGTS